MEMDEKYFVAKIQYDLPDENTGKIKKVREEKLVKGYLGEFQPRVEIIGRLSSY